MTKNHYDELNASSGNTAPTGEDHHFRSAFNQPTTLKIDLQENSEISVRIRQVVPFADCKREKNLLQLDPNRSSLIIKNVDSDQSLGAIHVGRDYETLLIVKDTEGNLVYLPDGWNNVKMHVLGADGGHGGKTTGAAHGVLLGGIKMYGTGQLILRAVVTIDGQNLGYVSSSEISVSF